MPIGFVHSILHSPLPAQRSVESLVTGAIIASKVLNDPSIDNKACAGAGGVGVKELAIGN